MKYEEQIYYFGLGAAAFGFCWVEEICRKDGRCDRMLGTIGTVSEHVNYKGLRYVSFHACYSISKKKEL